MSSAKVYLSIEKPSMRSVTDGISYNVLNETNYKDFSFFFFFLKNIRLRAFVY